MNIKMLLTNCMVFLSFTAFASAQTADSAAGKAVYTKSCSMCHNVDGSPKEAIAKVMKVEMRHLGSPEVQAKSDDALRKEIVDGVGKMKPVEGLSDADLVNVIAYIRTLKQ